MTTMSRTGNTIIDTVVGRVSVPADILLTIAGSLFIAVLAQVAIPIGPVPISAQTLGVLLIAAALGPRRAAHAVLLYLAQGALGLPVFAGGRAGMMVLAGPTGGYLVGFLAAALVVGSLSRAGWDRRPASAFAAMLIGSIVIYVPGVLWLARFTGWEPVLQLGVLPFLFGDLLKASIAATALPLVWSTTGKR